MYLINQNSKIPLHIQLYKEIKKDVTNHYKTGDKLPSIRKTASLYNLSKNTVNSAYSQLVAEGYIQSNPKSGYVAISTNFFIDKENSINELELTKTVEQYLYDFYPTKLSIDSFPLKLWKRLFTKVINESIDFSAYPDGQGEIGLREEITKYITQSRGVKCQANQIVICCGFADSMGLLARIVHNTYDTLAMENPGYHVAKKVFDSYGYRIKNINLNENGIKLDELKNSKAKLVYTTPSHQYPTGVSMPISNRLQLLEWANKVDGLIIEDDYDSELCYQNRPIPSLQGLDNFDRVVYLGTFSKSFSPAIRVSYMVLPKHLLPIYQEFFDIHFSRVSLMVQKTLELFMSQGHWESHLRKIRTINKKKHNLMMNQIKNRLENTVDIVAQGAGLAILINPKGKFNWDKLKNLAEKNKIKLYFAKDTSLSNWEAIRMGFGGFSEAEIPKAIESFSKIWNQCIR